jgi:hypothetical protein
MIPDDTHLLIGSLMFEGMDQIDLTGPVTQSGWRKARGFWQFCQDNRLYIVLHVEQSVLSAGSPKRPENVAARRLSTLTKG